MLSKVSGTSPFRSVSGGITIPSITVDVGGGDGSTETDTVVDGSIALALSKGIILIQLDTNDKITVR